MTGISARLAVAIGGLVCLAAACEGGQKQPEPSATGPSTTTLLDHAEGRELYVRWCIACHGDRGRGDGITASRLAPPPADLASPRIQDLGPDEVAARVSGGATGMGLAGVMPAWGHTLGPYQVLAVSSYVLSLGAAEAQEPQVQP